mgnify:CR=1 FL=1
MTDRVSITVKDHIADVKLVRTDKMNALDAKMFDALADAGTISAEDLDLFRFVESAADALDVIDNWEAAPARKAIPGR